MQPRLNIKQQQGVTLLEAIVAVSVFSIGILGMTAMQAYTQSHAKDQQQRNTAIWKAQELIERIKANNSNDAINAYVNAVNNANICDNPPAVTCAETYDSLANIEVAAAICDNSQLASYDSWEVMCSGVESLDRELADFRASLSCGVANCDRTRDLTVTLIWDSNLGVSDPRLSGTTQILDSNNNQTLSINAADNYFRQVFRP